MKEGKPKRWLLRRLLKNCQDFNKLSRDFREPKQHFICEERESQTRICPRTCSLSVARRTRRESRNLKEAHPAPFICSSPFFLVVLQNGDLNCWTFHVQAVKAIMPYIPFSSTVLIHSSINPLSFVHLSLSSLSPIILFILLHPLPYWAIQNSQSAPSLNDSFTSFL